MTDLIFNQREYDIRCEWGLKGVLLLAPISDVVVIVDVLSFSTAVEIATNQGAIVYPYRWNDETAFAFAESVRAEVAHKENLHGYKLSPASLRGLPQGLRLVIPSPNGSELSLSTGSVPTIAGCLRNSQAVAESAMKKGKTIAVIPAGEKWEDGALRPSLEDIIGAGAIISSLGGRLSPEARAAVAVFERSSSDLREQIATCSSGKEKVLRGEDDDLDLACEVNVSLCVPILENGAFITEKQAARRE